MLLMCICVHVCIQGVLNFMVGGRGDEGTEQDVKDILQHSGLMSRLDLRPHQLLSKVCVSDKILNFDMLVPAHS